MAAQGGQSTSTAVWVWSPLESTGTKPPHPADIPTTAASAKATWTEGKRGPRLARISAATLLQYKGSFVLIAEKGAVREVHKSYVLPWYEGLLLIEQLENGPADRMQASWCDSELRETLQVERAKFKNGLLSSALYIERRLLTVAVTGGAFLDRDNRTWAYRREALKPDDAAAAAEGEQAGGFFKVKEIIGYLPPWEAFCHEKCGFYQDFYQVRWEFPFSEVDYSRVENGSETDTGATWEPDECLPAQLDGLRMAAKKDWIAKRRVREQKVANEAAAPKKKADPPPQAEVGGGLKRKASDVGDAAGAKALKTGTPEEATLPPKLARLRRDGKPLIRDMFRLANGHDFVPPSGEEFTTIRNGWPKKPSDYPVGFEVANPPGFCFETCDCMDDQRPQKSWETHKAWLEDSARTEMANRSVEQLSQQKMVRKRGTVSKMFYFETATGNLGDATFQRAALDLAAVLQRCVLEVFKAIPVNALAATEGPKVRIPTHAIIDKLDDYEPLEYEITSTPVPSWIQLDPVTGELSSSAEWLAGEHVLKFDLRFSDSVAGSIQCTVLPPSRLGEEASWVQQMTPMIAQRFKNEVVCVLDPSVREVLHQHLSELYDFKKQEPRPVSLGLWLAITARLVRMLRCSSVAKMTLTAPTVPATPEDHVPQTPP